MPTHEAAAQAMDTALAQPSSVPGVVVVVLVDFMKAHRGWGWMRLVAGPAVYRGVAGLLGAKVMGSGQGGGFTLRPSATHQGLLCRFATAGEAMDFLHGEQVQAYRARARECWAGLLSVTAARGQWDQQSWGLSDDASTRLPAHWLERLPAVALALPLAALTRASIQPSKASAFWRHAPAAQAALDAAPGCALAIGLGEAPLLRQCTFSLWDSEDSLLAYARQGAHQAASAAAYKQQFFSESLFVRLRVQRMAGRWKERDFGNSLGWGGAVPGEVAHG